jgi:retron-type reverse transcriptase
MKKQFTLPFEELIGVENLLEAWREFLRGKRERDDVQEYFLNLMHNILTLHAELTNKTYRHGGYESFNISDPKSRNIHKACVRDRLLHHAIYRKLYPFFNALFIADSFSCRLNKGTHRALLRFGACVRKVGRNNTRTCWILKCDIRKFFANVDHTILMDILRAHIQDTNTLTLLENVIESFSVRPGVGLPLGNLTSQLFVNIYMNEFDQFAKHMLKAKSYLRYCDDFVVLSENKECLLSSVLQIRKFLEDRLKLELHPHKISIGTIAAGVDFLGWVHHPYHRTPRTTTKRRMFKRIKESSTDATVNSYLGLLKHGNTERLRQLVVKEYLLRQQDPYPFSPNENAPRVRETTWDGGEGSQGDQKA